ncbi:MAG: EamA family transporter [Desulfobacterales bacterium]
MNSAPTQKTLSLSAMAILTLLCASWGLNQVAIKVTNAGISPGFQAGIRSLGAGILIAFWMISRRESMFNRDGTLWWGIGVGLLFAFEFILLYWGLNYTTASRAVVFLYTMPFWWLWAFIW